MTKYCYYHPDIKLIAEYTQYDKVLIAYTCPKCDYKIETPKQKKKRKKKVNLK